MPYAAHQIVERRDAIVAELDRELEARSRVYPDRIGKGRMTQEEADYQIAIFREIRENVAQCDATWDITGRRFPWHDKVRALERELALRLRVYPDHVGKGRLTQADSDHRLEIAEMLRDLYWRCMFGWLPPAGSAAARYKADLRAGPWDGHRLTDEAAERIRNHPGRAEYEALVDAHIALVEGQDNGQQELQL